jgi:cullin-associated NEDD8-dissociated protein 1
MTEKAIMKLQCVVVIGSYNVKFFRVRFDHTNNFINEQTSKPSSITKIMSFSVSAIIEKSENRDKDLRHMAMYDLSQELQKDNVKLDETSQRQLTDVVLKLLNDNVSEVQGAAVKCLAPLVKKMSKVQIENAVTNLSKNILSGEDDKRDIATIALKTVVSEVPADMASGPIQKTIDPLLQSLKKDNQDVQLDALDVLNDILGRFGALVSYAHKDIQTSFIKQLESSRPTLRKRAIVGLGMLTTTTIFLFHDN